MIKRIARLALLCAASMQAAAIYAQAPFDLAAASIYDLRADPARLSTDAFQPGTGVLVHLGNESEDVLKGIVEEAEEANLHVVVFVPATSETAALLRFPVDAFLVDGTAPEVVALLESLRTALPRGVPPRIATSHESITSAHAVLIGVPAGLAGADADWDAAFSAIAASRPPRIVQLRTTDLDPALLRRLLLVPGGVLLDAVPEDEPARAVVAFRLRHPAVGAGRHERLVNSVYSFSRVLERPGRTDAVVVVFGASGTTTVNVSRAFADDTLLQDALTGETAFVSFGMARFDAHPSGLILIEEAR